MAADTTRHAASDSLTLILSLFFLSASLTLFTFLHSIISFPLHFFLPPFLLLPPHALLCEGIEFISERWAGHTTTINFLSASHTHSHTKVKLLTTVCQMNQTNPLCPFVSYKAHLSEKYWKKKKTGMPHTNTHKLCPEGPHSITHHLEWESVPMVTTFPNAMRHNTKLKHSH